MIVLLGTVFGISDESIRLARVSGYVTLALAATLCLDVGITIRTFCKIYNEYSNA